MNIITVFQKSIKNYVNEGWLSPNGVLLTFWPDVKSCVCLLGRK
jgi:hypothetical protein